MAVRLRIEGNAKKCQVTSLCIDEGRMLIIKPLGKMARGSEWKQ
jgi:hypothetical protein